MRGENPDGHVRRLKWDGMAFEVVVPTGTYGPVDVALFAPTAGDPYLCDVNGQRFSLEDVPAIHAGDTLQVTLSPDGIVTWMAVTEDGAYFGEAEPQP